MAASRRGQPLIDWRRLAWTELHVTRIDIVEVLALDGGRTLSASELAYELQRPLVKVHYHLQMLLRSGFVVPVDHRQSRGATEHFYCLEGHDGSDLHRRPPFDD